MAIIKMKKMLLISSNKNKKKVFKLLHEANCIEVKQSEFLPNVRVIKENFEYENLDNKIQNVNYAINIYKEHLADIGKICKQDKIKFKFGKRNALAPMPSVDIDEFYKLAANEKSLEATINEMRIYDSKIAELKTEKSKKINKIQQLMPYLGVDKNLSDFVGTKHTAIFLGLINAEKQNEIENLSTKYEDFVYEIYSGEKSLPVSIICLKKNKVAILEDLEALGFIQCPLKFDSTPEEDKNCLSLEIAELEKIEKENFMKLMEFSNQIETFKLYNDYYHIQKTICDYDDMMGNTYTSFILEFYVPIDKLDVLKGKLDRSELEIFYDVLELEKGEEPPVCTRHTRFVRPFESITNLLSSPRYDEIDPTVFVSIFFFFMSGIMISDFGYGLLITLASAFIIYKKKFKYGQGDLVKLIGLMGISGMIWGILFGTYFGFSSTNPDITQGIIKRAVLFDILEKPLPMLALGLGIGIVHILFGIALNAYSLIFKKKQYFAGIVHFSAWYSLVVGILMLGIKAIYSLIFDGKVLNVPSSVSGVGKILALIGIILLMLDSAIGKKGFRKVTGALSGLYGIINLLTDVLSYSRLFGLGLASAVVGFVFNNIAGVLINLIPYIGWIFAVLFFIAGHTFNMAIGALGAYVHGSRLEFVEFFGKFYQGGGKIFQPFGSDMKYYQIAQGTNNIKEKLS